MLFLTSKPRVRAPGGLWFIIPEHLQAKVVPYLQSKLSEVQDGQTRKHYRYNVLSKAALKALKDNYSPPVYIKAWGIGTFEIYSNWGKWRTNAGAIATCNLQKVQEELIAALEAFIIPE